MLNSFSSPITRDASHGFLSFVRSQAIVWAYLYSCPINCVTQIQTLSPSPHPRMSSPTPPRSPPSVKPDEAQSSMGQSQEDDTDRIEESDCLRYEKYIRKDLNSRVFVDFDVEVCLAHPRRLEDNMGTGHRGDQRRPGLQNQIPGVLRVLQQVRHPGDAFRVLGEHREGCSRCLVSVHL